MTDPPALTSVVIVRLFPEIVPEVERPPAVSVPVIDWSPAFITTWVESTASDTAPEVPPPNKPVPAVTPVIVPPLVEPSATTEQAVFVQALNRLVVPS